MFFSFSSTLYLVGNMADGDAAPALPLEQLALVIIIFEHLGSQEPGEQDLCSTSPPLVAPCSRLFLWLLWELLLWRMPVATKSLGSQDYVRYSFFSSSGFHHHGASSCVTLVVAPVFAFVPF